MPRQNHHRLARLGALPDDRAPWHPERQGDGVSFFLRAAPHRTTCVTPEDFRRVREIFGRACEFPASERGPFTRAAAAGDEDIIREVESLLAAEDEVVASEQQRTSLGPAVVPGRTMDIDLADAWFSRYCPVCNARYPLTRSECPEDGASLRDLSIAASWPTDTKWGQIAGLLDSLTVDRVPGDDAQSFRACSNCDSLVPPGRLECPRCRTRLSGGLGNGAWLDGLPGVFGGKWHISSREGGGAFGAFFLGEHHILGMRVGIKVLRSEFTATSEGRGMFHQEAMRVSRLNHPNIVKVLDYGEEESRPYLVMEYLSGRPLREFLEGGVMDVNDGVEVLRQTCVALSAAHTGAASGEPLVHLDLKPEHIFIEKVDGRWHVKVIDFGIAEIVSAPTSGDDSSAAEKRPLAGTLPYMAPERWKGVADPRCDIYALGVILYEVVAGSLPIMASHPDEFRRLHEEHVPPPPSRVGSSRRASQLVELDELILEALAKDPGDRPSSAEALAEALERWQTRPRRSRLTRVLRASAVSILVSLALIAVLFLWAPWEQLVLSSVPGVVGPRALREINATVSGLGYENGEAILAIEHPKSLEIPLGRVLEGEVTASVGWSGLEALAVDDSELECSARLRARGRLGRTLVSEPFAIRLDRRPPAIDIAAGGKVDDADESLLWMQSSLLTLRAGEPLDRERCVIALDERDPVGPVRSLSAPDAVSFEVLPETSRLTVRLADRAENVAERSWRVRWVVPSRVVSDHVLSTNQRNYELAVRLDRPPGKIEFLQIGADGTERAVEVRERGETEYFGSLEFTASSAVQVKNLRVSTWSPFSASKDGRPEEIAELEVRYLRRALSVVPASFHDDPRFPRSFEALGESAQVVTPPSLDWRVVASIADAGRQQSLKAGITRSGELVIDKDLASLKGRLLLNVVATDRYGNESAPWLEEYGIRIAKPAVSVTLRGEGSDRRRPLFHADCPCRRRSASPARLMFETKVEYGYPSEIETKFVIGDLAGVDVSSFFVDEGDGVRSVREDRLLPHLAEGENLLYFVGTDRTTGEFGFGRCSVFYGAPVSVAHSPDATPVAGERIVVTTAIQGAGERPKTVVFNGKSSEPQTHGSVQNSLSVHAVGETEANVVVAVGTNCELEFPLRYSRPPVEGQLYPIDLGSDVGRIPLAFHARDEAAGSFWYTSLDFGVRLRERFRASAMGRAFRESLRRRGREDASGARARNTSWREADAITRWLTRELAKNGWLRKDQRVSLPTLQQVTAVRGGRGVASDAKSPGREWLGSAASDRVPGFDATFAKTSPEGVVRLGASADANRAPFRVIVSAFKESDAAIPRRAIRSRPRREQ